MEETGITVHPVPGIGGAEVVFEVPVGDEQHALVLNDLLFNLPHQSGAAGWVLRYITASTGGLKCTRVGPWVLRWDLAQVGDFLRQRSEAPGLVALTVAHGDAVVTDTAEKLRSASDSL